MKSDSNTTFSSIPRSTARQNTLYSIERLENKIDQIASRNDLSANPGAADFFSKVRNELMLCRGTLKGYWSKQVYISQKLFDIQRDLIMFSSPADVYSQFLFIRRNALDTGEPGALSKVDEAKLVEIDEVLKKHVGEKQTAIPSKTIEEIRFFSKIVDDRAALTIWNGEKLQKTSARMSVVLLMGAFVLLFLVAIFDNLQLLEARQQCKLATTIRLMMCVFGGVVGAGVSSIASIRTSSTDEDMVGRVKSDRDKADSDKDGQPSIPFLNTDWVRPVLGAIAGLFFGLVVVSDVIQIPNITVMIAGAIAFGFSERILYSVLKKSSDQIGRNLTEQTATTGRPKK